MLLLESTLQKVRNAASGGVGLTKVANQVERISNAARGLTESGTKKLSNLATALARLGQIGNVKLSPSIGNQLQKIAAAAGQLQTVDLTKLTQLAEAMQPFSSLGTAHLTSYINQLGKLPDVIKELNAADLDKFIANIKELNTALAPFGDTMQKIANGFAAFPSRIQRLVQSTEKYNQTMSRANKVSKGGLWAFLNSSYSKYLALAGALGFVGNALGGFAEQSAEFNEVMNLFSISMGQYAEEAYEYAQNVKSALGIDIKEWMENQGMFKQILSAFGVIEEKAYTMSKGLTQIAYDAASFYDISLEESFTKLRSGITGEIEPLRALGVTLDAATLQQIAYDHGIKQNINTMTQAQKSQLRYVAIMEQMSNAMGDMGRTILEPANAMRILSSRTQELTREIGNLLIPMLMDIMPYAQAVVKALTTIIHEMALLAGYQMPEIKKDDTNQTEETLENISGKAEETAETLKELKNAMLGIDELNVISPKEAEAESGSFDLPFDVTANDHFLDVSEEYKQRIEELSAHILKYLQPIADLVKNLTPFFERFVGVFEALLQALLGFEDGGFLDWLDGVNDWLEKNPELVGMMGEMAAALTIAYTAIKLFDKLGELKAVKWLVEMFGNLTGKTKDLTDAYGKKNKTLEEQTEKTLGDAVAVGVLGAAAAGLVGILYRVRGWLKENPLTPELNPEPLTAASADVVRAIENGLSYSEYRLGLNRDITSDTLAQTESVFSEFALDATGYLQSIADASGATDSSVASAGEGMSNTLASVASSFGKSTSSMETALGKWATTVSTKTGSMIESWDAYVADFVSGAGDSMDSHDLLTESWNSYVEHFVGGTEKATDALDELNSDTEDILSEISKTFDVELDKSADYITEFTRKSETKYDSWASSIESATRDLTGTVKSAWDKVTQAVDDSVSHLGNKISEIKTMLRQFQSLDLSSIGMGILNNSPVITYKPSSSKSGSIPTVSGYDVALEEFWNDRGIKRAEQEAQASIESFFEGLANAFKLFGGAAGGLVGIPGFASGGYPDEGQLFIARERGAEMVGSIGGRTAVANNDQIVEAIREGVYDAVSAARSGDGGGDTYVYLDGEQIATRIEKRRKDNGLSIYSGGVM